MMSSRGKRKQKKKPNKITVDKNQDDQNVHDENLILPKKYSSRIYFTSHLFIILILVSFLVKLFHISLLNFIVFVTSLNYWKYPIRGLRRTIDMVFSFLNIITHVHASFYLSEFMIHVMYLSLVVISISFYFFARASKSDKNVSSKFHCGLHISGVITNLFLYYHHDHSHDIVSDFLNRWIN